MSRTNIIPFCLLSLFFERTCCFWPPPYQVHLNDSETFVISDMFDRDDAEEFSADDQEIIQDSYLSKHNLKAQPDKFYMIHQISNRHNREIKQEVPNTVTIADHTPIEEEYEVEDEPAYAELIGDDLNESKMYYKNEHIKNLVETRSRNYLKREKAEKEDVMYDDTRLKTEYNKQLASEKNSTNVAKYKDVKEEESAKDSMKNIVKFKAAKNCTKEEMRGIGSAAARCFFQDFKHAKKKEDKGRIFRRILKVLMIWSIVYVCIAIPCWCQKGWCCCCCRCSFCFPLRTIDETKKFLADNPVGVLHIEDGTKVTYTPTVYEKYAQKRLEQVVMKL